MAIDRWGPVSGELLDTRGSGTETLGNLPRRAAVAAPSRVWRGTCPPCLLGSHTEGKDTLPVTHVPQGPLHASTQHVAGAGLEPRLHPACLLS